MVVKSCIIQINKYLYVGDNLSLVQSSNEAVVFKAKKKAKIVLNKLKKLNKISAVLIEV